MLVLYVLNVPREMPLDAESPELGRVEAVLRRMEAIAKRNRCRAEGAMLQARDWGPAIVEEAKDRDAAVIVLVARNNTFATLQSLMPEVLHRLEDIEPCTLVKVRT